MTEQELFDTVAKHLLTQNKKSGLVNVRGNVEECLYRGPDGLKCAIGVLIPDEKYTTDLENLKATDPVIIEAANLQGVETLGDDLQHVHDMFHPKEWPQRLKALAKDYKLNSNVVDECTQKNVN